jgi:hypothetical protein
MAGETELERLVVRLTGDGSQYKRMLDTAISATTSAAEKIEQSTEKMGSGMVAKGVLIAEGVTLMVEKFKEFGKEALSAFRSHEDAEFKLKAVIEANGESVSKVTEEYEKFADTIGKTTTHGKVQVLQLLQMAETYGLTGTKAEQAVKHALGFEDALGHSAEGALRLTARLQQGSAEMLGRFVPGLDKATSEQAKLTLANDRFNKMFKVSESLTETTTGAITMFHKSIHSLFAELGGLVALGLKPIVKLLTEGIDAFQKLDPEIKKVTSSIAAFTAVTLAIGAASTYAPIVGAFKLLGTVIGFLTGPIGLVAAAIVGLGYLVVKHFGGISETFTAIKTKFDEFANYVRPVTTELGNIFRVVWDDILEAGQTTFNTLSLFISPILAKLGVLMTGFWDTFRRASIEALIGAEFAIRNWKEMLALAATFARLKFETFKEDAKYLFTDEIPNYLQNMTGVFKATWKAVFDSATDAFNQLGANLVSISLHLPQLLSGRMDFSQVWNPLVENFEITIPKIVPLAKRELSFVEKALTAAMKVMGGGLAASFMDFRAKRVGELLFPDKAIDAAVDKTANKLNTDILPVAKAINKELRPPDVVFWSATAITHARNQLFGLARTIKTVQTVGNATVTNVGGGVAGHARAAPAAVGAAAVHPAIAQIVRAAVGASAAPDLPVELEEGKFGTANLISSNRKQRQQEFLRKAGVVPAGAAPSIRQGLIRPKLQSGFGYKQRQQEFLRKAGVTPVTPPPGSLSPQQTTMTDQLLQQIVTLLSDKNKKRTLEVRPLGIA